MTQNINAKENRDQNYRTQIIFSFSKCQNQNINEVGILLFSAAKFDREVQSLVCQKCTLTYIEKQSD